MLVELVQSRYAQDDTPRHDLIVPGGPGLVPFSPPMVLMDNLQDGLTEAVPVTNAANLQPVRTSLIVPVVGAVDGEADTRKPKNIIRIGE